MDQAKEIQGRMYHAFLEYFGLEDPVFCDPLTAEKGLNNFIEWYSTQWVIPERGKTPFEMFVESEGVIPDIPEFNLPDRLMEENMEVGVIFDKEWGIYILPYYGEVVEILSGRYREVPDHEDMVRALVEEENFIPSFLIRKLIARYPESSVEAFRSVYSRVEDQGDLFQLLKSRKDWKKKSSPSVIPVKISKSSR